MVCAKSPFGCSTRRQLRKSRTSRWKASLSASPACSSSTFACPTRSSARFARLMSTSSTGPWPHHSPSRWPSTSASSPRRSKKSKCAGSRAPAAGASKAPAPVAPFGTSIGGKDAIRCASPRPGCRRRSGAGRSCFPPARTAHPLRQGRLRRCRQTARPTGSRLRVVACRCRARAGARAPRQEHEHCQRDDAQGRPWHGRKPPRAASHHSRRLPLATLGFMRLGGFANPGAILPGVTASLHPLLRDRPFASDHRVEFVPVDLAEIVAALLLIPLEAGVGNGEAEKIRLRHRDIDKLLAKLVIGLALDAPPH